MTARNRAHCAANLKSTLLTVILGSALGALAAEPFPRLFNTEKDTNGPLPAAEAAARMKLPPGFKATVFAAEPDVQQPIGLATDPKGRLWVAENYSYSERAAGYHSDMRDRIVAFEDADNDGRFDRRTVFWDGAQRLTSVEVGLGGVWALCPPNLYFIPDRNGDAVADGPPEVVLDGFEYLKARHTIANGLRWGPDGWLYGRHGIQSTSTVGIPGTPPEQRVAMNVGIWRYHPARRVFEVVAEGTTNPWGMDWDARGEAFFINTVIGHLWHVIPGAHYRRMYGEDPNPYVYDIIEQHADHVHWATGEVWTDVRKGVTDATFAAGGGHAHTGLLIYQGGQWPGAWSGKLLTVNFHGRQLNVERLERDGSGFVGRREPDTFASTDPWFRGLDLLAAPDGGVFLSDWSDAGECHDHDGIHRTSGRIFKLTYGDSKPRTVGDLGLLDGAALAKLQVNANDWLARQSRRVLADRAAAGRDNAAAVTELNRIVKQETNPVFRLRALWALHVAGASSPARLALLLSDPDESVRAWALRLLEDQRHGDAMAAPAFAVLAQKTLPQMAARESSALVRLGFASLLQKLPPADRSALATALLAHSEDSGDHNLPLMLWWGIEPLARIPGGAFEKLIASASVPRVQRFGARRLAEEIDFAPARLDTLLATVADQTPDRRLNVLEGVAEGFAGRRKAPKPVAWDALETRLVAGATEPLRNRVRDLSALFGDGRALDEIRAVALDPAADLAVRRSALQVLVESRAPGLRAVCEALLPVRETSVTAASGLALSEDAAAAELLLREWPRLGGTERPSIMGVLVSRPAWAAKVLDAIAAGRLEKGALSAFQARQIRGYHDANLTQRLESVWGKVRETPDSGRESALAKWKSRFPAEALAKADKTKGRAIFQAACAGCHILNGEGGAIGPELTGAARDNLDYLLDNILFPSALVPDQYRQVTLHLKDGRSLSGMVRTRTAVVVRLQTATELVAVPVAEVAREESSSLSLMPEGLLDALDENQARELMAYLMSKTAPARAGQ
jgi:putative membrane-bound dehydrogenase-like protein